MWIGLVTAGVLLMSCVTGGPEASGTVAPPDDSLAVQTTVPTPDARTDPNDVAGRVATEVEAFCAGFLQMAEELGSSQDLGVDFESCLESGLAEEVGFGESGEVDALATAFAVGCGLMLADHMSGDFNEQDLAAADGLQIAITACFQSNFEGWLPGDYVITRIGVCYLAVDTPDLPGCRTEAGELVTTTTVSYVGGDVSEFVASVQNLAPTSLPMSQDRELVLTYGQELCTELRDFGGFEFSEWIVDVVANGSGFPDVPESDWQVVRSLIDELPGLATAHLCPELASEWEESLQFGREVHDIPYPSAFGGTVGEAIFYSNDPMLKDLWDDTDREALHEIGRTMCGRLDEGRSREDVSAQVRTDTVTEQEFAHLSVESSDYLATAIMNGAIHGYCPRHSPSRWADLMSRPWPFLP